MEGRASRRIRRQPPVPASVVGVDEQKEEEEDEPREPVR